MMKKGPSSRLPPSQRRREGLSDIQEDEERTLAGNFFSPSLSSSREIFFSSLKKRGCKRVRRDKEKNKRKKGEEQEEEEVPNQQRILNKVPTELRCRNFVNNHRLSIQISIKHGKACVQCVHIPTELPLCMPPLVVGLVKSRP